MGWQGSRTLENHFHTFPLCDFPKYYTFQWNILFLDRFHFYASIEAVASQFHPTQHSSLV
ncbi:hypothetical protein T09_3959 [Trichinella sp. T9]|nr:hypothetical protein T09_3959 [Trichinella sp. T9]KRZ83524.1 hypothetical protein T08_9152 [Trichinella sp. T8]